MTREGEDVRRFYPLRLQFDHLINFQGGTYQNVDGATAKGCELELLGWWASGFRGRVSYALQDTEFHQPGVLRSDSPKQLGKLNLIAPVMKDKPVEDYPIPGNIVFVPVDEMGRPGRPGTPGVQMEAFIAGTEPHAVLAAVGAEAP